MDNWDEIRTAFHVARMGTVSGAADTLGVHHATVIRHIDALEKRLGAKLFQRHPRGYTATEAGEDLLQVAQTIDDQFTQLVGRIKGRGESVSGELTITSLASLAPLVVPSLTRFQAEHEDLNLRFLTGDRLFRLEYGEAHVAIRAGSAPDQPDNVVQPFARQRVGLYASKSYIATYGQPAGEADLDNHRFVGPESEESRAPFNQWLRSVHPEAKVVFRATDAQSLRCALLEGVGLGFLPVWDARNIEYIVEVLPPRDEWSAAIWLVTHVDLHRTPKVQAVLKHLKDEARAWGDI